MWFPGFAELQRGRRVSAEIVRMRGPSQPHLRRHVLAEEAAIENVPAYHCDALVAGLSHDGAFRRPGDGGGGC